MKNERQRTIEELIESNVVSTQDELSELLRARGFKATQATVSRDIKELRLVKSIDPDGATRYTRPSREDIGGDGKFVLIFREAVISVATAGNLVVIKCHVGMGNAACAALDSMRLPHIVGTIAGDDTIFVAVDTPQDALELKKNLHQILL